MSFDKNNCKNKGCGIHWKDRGSTVFCGMDYGKLWLCKKCKPSDNEPTGNPGESEKELNPGKKSLSDKMHEGSLRTSDVKEAVRRLMGDIDFIQKEVYGNCELTEEANLFCSLIKKKIAERFGRKLI